MLSLLDFRLANISPPRHQGFRHAPQNRSFHSLALRANGVSLVAFTIVLVLTASVAYAQDSSKTSAGKTKPREKMPTQVKSKLISSEGVKPVLKLEEVTEAAPAAEAKQPPIRDFKPIPAHEFTGVQEWINTRPLDMESLRGRVVVLHFWTFGCSNCLHNLPHYAKWQKEFAKQDVTIIGVHTPETAAEHDIGNVRQKVKTLGITYPVAVDGNAENWKQWRVSMWPTVGIIDRRGYLRYYWEGELNWKGAQGEEYMRGKIGELLAEKVDDAKP